MHAAFVHAVRDFFFLFDDLGPLWAPLRPGLGRPGLSLGHNLGHRGRSLRHDLDHHGRSLCHDLGRQPRPQSLPPWTQPRPRARWTTVSVDHRGRGAWRFAPDATSAAIAAAAVAPSPCPTHPSPGRGRDGAALRLPGRSSPGRGGCRPRAPRAGPPSPVLRTQPPPPPPPPPPTPCVTRPSPPHGSSRRTKRRVCACYREHCACHQWHARRHAQIPACAFLLTRPRRNRSDSDSGFGSR